MSNAVFIARDDPAAYSRLQFVQTDQLQRVVAAMSQTEALSGLLESVRVLIRSGDGQAALESAEAAVGQYPMEAEAHEMRATVLFLMQRYDDAVASLKAALDCDPRRAPAMVNLGAVYNRQKQFDKAVEVLRRAVQADKRSAEAYYNLGYALRNLNQFTTAIPAYREAIRLNPKMADAHQNLGNVYLEMRNYHQAIASYSKALEISPDHSKALRGLQRAHEERDANKVELSPFGRLVEDPAQSGPSKIQERRHRPLSAEERFSDRQRMAQSAAMMENEVKGLCEVLANELRTILKRLDRSLSELAGPAVLMDQRREFDSARARLAMHARKLARLQDSMVEHERSHVIAPQ